MVPSVPAASKCLKGVWKVYERFLSNGYYQGGYGVQATIKLNTFFQLVPFVPVVLK